MPAGYVLPIASTDHLGGVMVDGKSVIADKDGKITAVPTIIEYSEIIYLKENNLNGGPEMWKVNFDGTDNQKINIILPANLEIDFFNVGFKRTSTKIIFGADYKSGKDHNHFLYTCNIDGSEVHLITKVGDDYEL